jgi:hypothetical protein
MIAAIEDAILALLQANLSSAYRIAVQKGYEGIPQPAVYVSTEEGKFKPTTMKTWEQHITIYIDIIFKSLNSEQQRRAGIYPILESCIQILLLQTLGLKIHALQPVAFRNVTTEELLREGFIAFCLTYQTHYFVSISPPEDVQELLTLGMNYYLSTSEENTGGGTDTPDAKDIFVLPQD